MDNFFEERCEENLRFLNRFAVEMADDKSTVIAESDAGAPLEEEAVEESEKASSNGASTRNGQAPTRNGPATTHLRSLNDVVQEEQPAETFYFQQNKMKLLAKQE